MRAIESLPVQLGKQCSWFEASRLSKMMAFIKPWEDHSALPLAKTPAEKESGVMRRFLLLMALVGLAVNITATQSMAQLGTFWENVERGTGWRPPSGLDFRLRVRPPRSEGYHLGGPGGTMSNYKIQLGNPLNGTVYYETLFGRSGWCKDRSGSRSMKNWTWYTTTGATSGGNSPTHQPLAVRFDNGRGQLRQLELNPNRHYEFFLANGALELRSVGQIR